MCIRKCNPKSTWEAKHEMLRVQNFLATVAVETSVCLILRKNYEKN